MFGGFKASLNLFGGKRNKKGLYSELSPDMTLSGAYRTSRDDFFGFHNSFEQSKKSTASEQMIQQMRPTKSTSDLTKTKNTTPNLRYSTGEISRDPRGAQQVDPRNGPQNLKLTKNQEKEQKKLEKQRLAEQKAREKQAAQEQAKQEKLRKEREKREAQRAKAKRGRRPEKKQAPQPLGSALNPLPEPSVAQYSTNTLESSISRSSGPPPYTDVPTPRPAQSRNAQSQGDSSGNVIYSKPVDTGSWDMISQHRQQQQTIRPTTTIGGGGKQKHMVMDLNYNLGATSQAKNNSDQVKDNSDA